MRLDMMVHITDFDQVILNIPFCYSFAVDEMTHSVADFSSKVVGLRKKFKFDANQKYHVLYYDFENIRKKYIFTLPRSSCIPPSSNQISLVFVFNRHVHCLVNVFADTFEQNQCR